MPIYEFQCQDCNHIAEFRMAFNDPAPNQCPECNSPNLQKIISRTNFVLKGGGWYSDSYDGNSNQKSEKPTKKEEKSSPEATDTVANSDGAKSTKAKPKTEPAKAASKPAGDSKT